MTTIIATIIGIITTALGALYLVKKQRDAQAIATTQLINNISQAEKIEDTKLTQEHKDDVTHAQQANPIDLLNQLRDQLHAR